MDDGIEKIDDDEVKRALRRLARKVYAESIGAGIALAVLFFLIPL